MLEAQQKAYFEDNFKKYSGDIFRYGYLRLSDYELAQDLTEEVFLNFWRKLSGGMEFKNTRTMLYTIAHGMVVDIYRKKGRQNVSIEVLDERLFARNDQTEENIDKQEKIKVLYKKMRRLKQEYRNVLVLHYVQDIKIADLAKIIGKQENATRVLLHRALKTLKAQYE